MEVGKLTIAGYESFLSSHGRVVVHFWADWNRYDDAVRESLEALAKSHSDMVAFASFDTSPKEHWDKCIELKIAGLPVLILYKDGKQFETLRGVDLQSRDHIESGLKRAFELNAS